MEISFNGFSKEETLNKKIALESIFFPEVSSYLNKILKDFKKVFSATGILPNPEDYVSSTTELLRNHYTRVAKVFEKNLRSGMKEIKQFGSFEEEAKKELSQANEIIDAALILFIMEASKKRARFLIDTNNKEILKKIDKSRVKLVEEGIKNPTNKQLANESSEMLKKTFDGRKETITITETQFMAESTKQIESNVLAGEKPYPAFPIVARAGIIIKISKKEWRTVLDERTRDAHAIADGQIRKIMEPYVVGGELLMFPGDSSLGASIWNTINCRCDSNNNILWNMALSQVLT